MPCLRDPDTGGWAVLRPRYLNVHQAIKYMTTKGEDCYARLGNADGVQYDAYPVRTPGTCGSCYVISRTVSAELVRIGFLKLGKYGHLYVADNGGTLPEKYELTRVQAQLALLET